MWYGASASSRPMATEECQPLAMNFTPSRVIASVTALTAFSGLDWLSMYTISTSRCSPSITSGRSPAARASSSAMATPFLISSPVRLAGPVNGPLLPILSGSPAAWARHAALATRNAALAVPALPATSRKRRRDTAAAGATKRRPEPAVGCFSCNSPPDQRGRRAHARHAALPPHRIMKDELVPASTGLAEATGGQSGCSIRPNRRADGRASAACAAMRKATRGRWR